MPPEYSLLISQPGSEVPNYGGGGGVLGKSISGGNLRQMHYVKCLGQNLELFRTFIYSRDEPLGSWPPIENPRLCLRLSLVADTYSISIPIEGENQAALLKNRRMLRKFRPPPNLFQTTLNR